jgi:hypothetical protein
MAGHAGGAVSVGAVPPEADESTAPPQAPTAADAQAGFEAEAKVNYRLRYLGTPRDASLSLFCGYSPSPRDPACPAESVWHGFVLDDLGRHIIAMMSSCDDHKRAMALTADFIHAVASPCAAPGSRFIWPENYCYLPWDEIEQAFAALAETAMAAAS